MSNPCFFPTHLCAQTTEETLHLSALQLRQHAAILQAQAVQSRLADGDALVIIILVIADSRLQVLKLMMAVDRLATEVHGRCGGVVVDRVHVCVCVHLSVRMGAAKVIRLALLLLRLLWLSQMLLLLLLMIVHHPVGPMVGNVLERLWGGALGRIACRNTVADRTEPQSRSVCAAVVCDGGGRYIGDVRMRRWGERHIVSVTGVDVLMCVCFVCDAVCQRVRCNLANRRKLNIQLYYL